jgi:hypothetical protein
MNGLRADEGMANAEAALAKVRTLSEQSLDEVRQDAKTARANSWFC